MDSSGKIDEIDRKILKILKDNARMSYTDIGSAVGLSRVAVKTRIAALEDSGFIKGYKAVIDETANSKGIPFYLELDTMPDGYVKIIESLLSEPRFSKVCGSTGECKILAFGYAANSSDLSTFTRSFMYGNQSLYVRRMFLNVITDVYKDKTV